MGHGLFEEKISLDEVNHIYSDKFGNNYMGFTQLFDFIGKPFFANLHKTVAISEGVDPSEVRQRWDNQRDEGSRIDAAVSEFAASGKIADANIDLKEAINQILAHYSDYNKTFEQLVVYNEDYRIATAIDKCGLFTNRKDSSFFISDFKCYESMQLFEHKGWLKAPLEHLPDTKFIKIALQLAFGAFMFEKLTGKRCKSLFIHLIKPSTCKKIGDEEVKVEQQIIHVPYLRMEIELLLSYFGDAIKAKLAEQKQNKELSINDLI